MFNFFSKKNKNADRNSSSTDDFWSRYKNGEKFSDLIPIFENYLLMLDVDYKIVKNIIEFINTDTTNVENLFYSYIVSKLKPLEYTLDTSKTPNLLFFIGINGAGKTSTIAKLANLLIQDKKSVSLIAGDTFRAAAIEQLKQWSTILNLPIVHQKLGSDSASVVYDGINSSINKNINIILSDTAGRLHNKDNLMKELQKILSMKNKFSIPIEQKVFLVLDSTIGKNNLNQIEAFSDIAMIDAIIYTKIDSCSKGGSILNVAEKTSIPIAYLTYGETLNDITPFSAEYFANNLIANS